MKKIISGVLYDTEKALLIGGHESANDPGSFEYWEASLYKTPRSGRYFLAGSGGPMTRFARPLGSNEWSGGEKLEPLTESAALEWAQEYLDTEEVQSEFPQLIEEA